ncbi:hypothetical protein HK100_000028 [Physocladia obscura]|uniref:Uncharacterized protein n=1 Tax=Physocladia obscura TaxID=109957 RepID=A0AAD5TAJ1_9FUNG|nr:hypothetical protein HK100_000028 [Physocladia obscura]
MIPSTNSTAATIAATGSNSSKKETRKRRPVTSKMNRIQKYETDESGAPILPITTTASHTVHSFGSIVHDRSAYHTERYIFPVGYKCVKSFLSILDPDKTMNYMCEILDGGDSPKFVVTPEECPDRAVSATSATGAWVPFLKAAHGLRQKEHHSGLSGPDFFGLTQGIVTKCIQELPNARLCKNYVWQEFEFIANRAPKRVKLEPKPPGHASSTTSLDPILSSNASLENSSVKNEPTDSQSRVGGQHPDDNDDDDLDAMMDSDEFDDDEPAATAAVVNSQTLGDNQQVSSGFLQQPYFPPHIIQSGQHLVAAGELTEQDEE